MKRPKGASVLSLIDWLIAWCTRVPDSLIAALGRFSIAAVFWKSGQTKIEGFAVDLVDGTFELGWPRLAESAVYLFQDEYRVPFIPPDVAATIAALSEHLFPLLILVGLATRFSALALLVMTFVIQTFVYPDAYPTHGVWATVLLVLIAKGPGVASVDHLLWGRRRGVSGRMPAKPVPTTRAATDALDGKWP